MNRIRAIWNLLTGVMNISSRAAGEYLFTTLLVNLTLVFVGWLLNITGHMGWNFVFVFAFVAFTSIILIPWVAIVVFPLGIDKRVGWIMLAEASTFLVLATLPLAAYPEGFWAGFGAIMVLSLTAYIWPSTVSWLRRFAIGYGVAVLALAILMTMTGAPTYYDAWEARVHRDREAGELDSEKWAKKLEELPKIPYEDMDPTDRRTYDEAQRRIRNDSVPGRLAEIRKDAIGFVYDPRTEIKRAVTLSSYTDTAEVCDPRLTEGDKWTVTVQDVRYDKIINGKPEKASTTKAFDGKYSVRVDGTYGLTGTPFDRPSKECWIIDWNIPEDERTLIRNGTITMETVTFFVEWSP